MNNCLLDPDFVLLKSDTFNGIIPILNNICDREIDEFICRYKKLVPFDKRNNDELRPFVVNTILHFRKKKPTV